MAISRQAVCPWNLENPLILEGSDLMLIACAAGFTIWSDS